MFKKEKELYKSKSKEDHLLDELLHTDSGARSTEVKCPSCLSKISAQDVDLSSQLCKCHNCDIVFSAKEIFNSLHIADKKRHDVEKPQSVEEFRMGTELELTIDQSFNWIDALCMSILFIGFIITLGYFKGKASQSLMAISWLLNLGSIYYFSNRSKARLIFNLDEHNLTRMNRPKNGTSDKVWPIHSIQQFYVKSDDYGLGLMMIIKDIDGVKHQKIASGVKTRSEAYYLEQTMEAFLGLPNKPVIEEDKIE